MIKKLIIYTLALVCFDGLLNLIFNLLQNNPGGVIITSAIIRSIVIFALFVFSWSVGSKLFKEKGSTFLLILTSLIVYFLIPISLYLLNESARTLKETYMDIYTNINLFTLIYLPFIIASVVCISFNDKVFKG